MSVINSHDYIKIERIKTQKRIFSTPLLVNYFDNFVYQVESYTFNTDNYTIEVDMLISYECFFTLRERDRDFKLFYDNYDKRKGIEHTDKVEKIILKLNNICKRIDDVKVSEAHICKKIKGQDCMEVVLDTEFVVLGI
ncbi:hypothetical protein EBB07_28800 [Paenibacillaceae bacterium]|nr:hypothetical protein EBB07_28800 [Paenibacillaceae bacterium]